MQKCYLLLVVVLLLCFTNKAQTWMLKLSRTIELRTWKLTSTAEKTDVYYITKLNESDKLLEAV